MNIKKVLSSMTLAGIISIAGGLTATSVYAAEYKDPEPLPEGTTIEDTFFDQVDDDRVLPMPDGGFLHGEIIEVDAEDPSKVIGIYNSSLDPNAVTVEEAKKIMSGEKSYVTYSTRAAYPSTTVRYLEKNGIYKSDYFSGGGWRFGHYYFLPTAGTGDYLAWTSYMDSGRVGSFSKAYDTMNGILSGMELPANTRVYYKNANGQQYYTYNPLTNTHYYVENK